MDWQIVVVAVLVVACSSRAAWVLMPRSLQQRIARLRGVPQPVTTGCGSGCDGCSAGPARPPKAHAQPGVSVVRFVRRPVPPAD